MTLRLAPVPIDADPDAPAASLAPGFGGDPAAGRETLTQENASTRALRRISFVHAGETIDPEDGLVGRWERRT